MGPEWLHMQLFCILQLHQIICFLFFFWQQKVEFDPTSSYAVEGLKPDTLYKFRLGARSELGVGVYTPIVEARTAQSSKCLLFNTAGDKSKAVQFPSPGHREAQSFCPCGFAGMLACSLLKGVVRKSAGVWIRALWQSGCTQGVSCFFLSL